MKDWISRSSERQNDVPQVVVDVGDRIDDAEQRRMIAAVAKKQRLQPVVRAAST